MSSGITALGALASLAIYRPYFIGLAGLALIYSIWTTFVEVYRPRAVSKASQFGKQGFVLTLTTFLVFFAVYFPYVRGMAPWQKGRTYEGKGLVIEVDSMERKITISHEQIEKLMPAMSMEYDVEARASLRDLKPGDKIRFNIAPRNIGFVVLELTKEDKPRSRLQPSR